MSSKQERTSPAATDAAPIAATETTFAGLNLAEPLLRALSACGFERPTEIQARAIPPALEGQDLMASAQTGTGKTAAFVLPALQRLLQPAAGKGRGPRVLVLTPTRELAGQVEGVIRELGRYTRLRSATIVGGVSYGPQEKALRGPLDLLVATPGRLLDHMESGLVDFSRLELLVLDEADRMLDMGFVKPVTKIADAIPTGRTTYLFSATLEGEVQRMAKRLLREPVRIEMARAKERHMAIAQHLHMVENPEHKAAVLSQVLAHPELTQAIVFTATKRGADRLSKRLNTAGHASAPLHGNMRQNARLRTVEDLRRGRVQILVATDVAARGIDIEGVSHVINYDLPTVAEDYIHRIGRTGRNGATGTAVSLVGPDDRGKLAGIERLTGYRMERRDAGVSVPPRANGNGHRAEPRTERTESTPQPAQRPHGRRGGNGGGGNSSGSNRGGNGSHGRGSPRRFSGGGQSGQRSQRQGQA